MAQDWQYLIDRLGVVIIEAADYYGLSDIPPHVRRSMEKVKLAIDATDATLKAQATLDVMFMYCLRMGKPQTRAYCEAKRDEHLAAATRFKEKGWEEAAKKRLEEANIWAKKAQFADEEGPLKRAFKTISA